MRRPPPLNHDDRGAGGTLSEQPFLDDSRRLDDMVSHRSGSVVMPGRETAAGTWVDASICVMPATSESWAQWLKRLAPSRCWCAQIGNRAVARDAAGFAGLVRRQRVRLRRHSGVDRAVGNTNTQ
jgi:hypothetical protein